jgi:hypothetical protein
LHIAGLVNVIRRHVAVVLDIAVAFEIVGRLVEANVVPVVCAGLLHDAFLLGIVPSPQVHAVAAVYVGFEIGIRIRTNALVLIRVPVRIQRNGAVVAPGPFGVAVIRCLVVEIDVWGMTLQTVGVNCVCIEIHFNYVGDRCGVDRSELLRAEFPFVPKSVPRSQAIKRIEENHTVELTQIVLRQH